MLAERAVRADGAVPAPVVCSDALRAPHAVRAAFPEMEEVRVRAPWEPGALILNRVGSSARRRRAPRGTAAPDAHDTPRTGSESAGAASESSAHAQSPGIARRWLESPSMTKVSPASRRFPGAVERCAHGERPIRAARCLNATLAANLNSPFVRCCEVRLRDGMQRGARGSKVPESLTSPPEGRTFPPRVTFVWCSLLSRCAGPDGYPPTTWTLRRPRRRLP